MTAKKKDDRHERILEAATASPNRLRTLSTHKVREVRLAVLKRPDCPLDVLIALSEDHTVKVRLAVAKHSATPPHILEKLAYSSNLSVRENAVGNDGCPSEVVADVLAATPDVHVGRVADIATHNASLDPEAHLAVSRAWSTAHAGRTYSHDWMCTTVRRLLRHAGCTPASVIALVDACATPELFGLLLDHEEGRADVLREAAYHLNPEVRALALGHPDCDPDDVIVATLMNVSG